MNLIFSLSVVACVIGLFFAAFTGFMSRAPGLSQLRLFAYSCLCGSLYAACNAVMLSPVSPETGLWMDRVSLMLGGLHGASWYLYRAARERRSLSRLEQGIVGVGVLFGVSSLIPGLLYGDPWAHRIEWLDITYQDAESTTLGDLCFVYFGAALMLPFVRSVRGVWRGDRTEIADAIGLGLLLTTGFHDVGVASGQLPTPYLLDLGYLLLMFSVALSLTIRFKATTIRLAEAQDELVRQERLAALGELSAVVAHEVRNPVAIIFNALASLKKLPEGDARRAELLAIVEEEADRLRRMVSDLLDFARPQHVALATADLAAVVEGAISAARATFAQSGATPVSNDNVTTELAAELPEITCDPELVRQALVNLIANALAAEGRRGPVVVRAELVAERVVISVVDDGEGVPEQNRGRIFQPFFTTRATGIGLGLPVVARIAEAHGGELSYRPTPGGGATFRFSLAAGDAEAAAPARPWAPSRGPAPAERPEPGPPEESARSRAREGTATSGARRAPPSDRGSSPAPAPLGLGTRAERS